MSEHPLPATMRNTAVATYGTQEEAEDAVRALEHGGFNMEQLSILAKGMSTERHVMGFDTAARRIGRWSGFGAVWGALFGAFFFIPGVGHVALGGYVLYLLVTTAIGAGSGALGAALSSLGIPDDAVIRYETAIGADKFLLIAHGTPEDVERAREILAGGSAESVETHVAAAVA